MTSSEKAIRTELGVVEEALIEAERAVDSSTEYIADDLMEFRVRLRELLNKLDRDAVLQRDREAFAEPSIGLKEWLHGGPRQR